MNKRIFWKFLRSGRAAALVLLAALLLSVALSGCKSEDGGTQPTGQEQTETAAPASSSYCMTTSQGETLETVPGYSYVSCTKTLSGSDHGASILIPPIFSYTEDTFNMGSETEDNGFCELIFSYEGYADTDFVSSYAADLSAYGFTLGETWAVDSDQTNYYLNYNGSITHGAAKSWDGTAYDLSITAYQSVSRTIVIFRYPSEVGFDVGTSENGSHALEVTTGYSVRENGADTFTITGWGDTPEDEIYLWFLPDRYGTGSVLEREDFAAQSAAGASGLCHLSFYGDLLGGSMGNCDISAVDDVTVTVLERSDSVCAISYTINVKNGSTAYLLEGVCAAKLSGGSTVSYTEPDSGSGTSDGLSVIGNKGCIHCNGTGKIKCTFCNGAGFTICHTCGGDGTEQCSLCGGTGQYWANGGYRSCNGCFGRGSKPCSSSQCNNGKVYCNFCTNGMKTCNYCMGTGK